MYEREYKEKDFIAGMSTCLYENEEMEIAKDLCRAICDGRSLLDIAQNPGNLDTFTPIRTLINEIAPVFASSKCEVLEKEKYPKSFLRNFIKNYFPKVKMSFKEAYTCWVVFVMQRLMFSYDIPLDISPFTCEEEGYVERLFLTDDSFPAKVAIAFGECKAMGSFSNLSISEYTELATDCLSMYETAAFSSHKTIDDWAKEYWKGKLGVESMRNTINDCYRLILLIDKELEDRNKSVPYKELLEIIEFVLLNSKNPFENYKQWIDFYETMKKEG